MEYSFGGACFRCSAHLEEKLGLPVSGRSLTQVLEGREGEVIT